MVIEGTYTFPAPVERVLAALTDPETLGRAVPGCERVMQLGPAGANGAITLELRLRAGAGPSVYTATADLAPQRAPTGLRVELRGRGPAGPMSAVGSLDLAAEGAATVGRYRWEVDERGLRDDERRALDGDAGADLAQSLCERLAAQLRMPPHAVTGGALRIKTARGHVVAVPGRAANVAVDATAEPVDPSAGDAIAFARQALWMSAGLVVGLGALALTISLTRRLRPRNRPPTR